MIWRHIGQNFYRRGIFGRFWYRNRRIPLNICNRIRLCGWSGSVFIRRGWRIILRYSRRVWFELIPHPEISPHNFFAWFRYKATHKNLPGMVANDDCINLIRVIAARTDISLWTHQLCLAGALGNDHFCNRNPDDWRVSDHEIDGGFCFRTVQPPDM